MIEDNGDPLNPASAAYIGARAAEAEEAASALSPDEHAALQWENEGGRVTETHDGLYRAKCKALAAIVDEKIGAKERAHAAYKVASAELDAAYEDLHKAAKDDEQYLPFGQPAAGGDSKGGAEVYEQDDSWRAVPLDQALDGLSKGIHDSFKKNDPPLECVGDLADWCKDNRLIDIPGVGGGKAEKIEESLERFWSRRAKAAQPQQQEDAQPQDPAQNDLESLKASAAPAPVTLVDGPADQHWKAESEQPSGPFDAPDRSTSHINGGL